ncbi:hypothetical protein PV10_01322 [Exophiala mesophila]|uniref:Uncharacterized protein n=1 Tax=Exophiala mesophila TaxID=212818 RepID=A0A0D1YAG1_EXOME|nr:uncharacterized protein PV10_01322 [Exophiala mesophila]KIV97591.1 hypothetical protein PV10_01322 [Exophiala mesophila]
MTYNISTGRPKQQKFYNKVHDPDLGQVRNFQRPQIPNEDTPLLPLPRIILTRDQSLFPKELLETLASKEPFILLSIIPSRIIWSIMQMSWTMNHTFTCVTINLDVITTSHHSY